MQPIDVNISTDLLPVGHSISTLHELSVPILINYCLDPKFDTDPKRLIVTAQLQEVWNRLKTNVPLEIVSGMLNCEHLSDHFCSKDLQPHRKVAKLFIMFSKQCKQWNVSQTCGEIENFIPLGQQYRRLIDSWTQKAYQDLYEKIRSQFHLAEDDPLLPFWNNADNLPKLSGITQLNFMAPGAGLRLEMEIIPPAIGLCHNLTKLCIHQGGLSYVPEVLGGCINLIELTLSGNSIRILPDSLENCKELQLVNLNSNCLSHFPRFIDKLKKLESLFLSYNQIENISELLGNCTKLVFIEMNNNKIKTLSTSFEHCHDLLDISFNTNQIHTITSSFKCHSRGPESRNQLLIDLSDNQITSICSSFLEDHVHGPELRSATIRLSNNPIFPAGLPSYTRASIYLYAFNTYKCQSNLSSFVKLISTELDDPEKIKKAFSCLTTNDQCLIFKALYEESATSSRLIFGVDKEGNLEKHCSEHPLIPETITHFDQEHLTDHQWGEHHLFDAMPLLARATWKAIHQKFKDLSSEDKWKVYEKLSNLTEADSLPIFPDQLKMTPTFFNCMKAMEERIWDNPLMLLDAMEHALQ